MDLLAVTLFCSTPKLESLWPLLDDHLIIARLLYFPSNKRLRL